MNRDDIERLLKGATLTKSSSLEGTIDRDGEVSWRSYNVKATVDGDFDADALEAIAIWMRENYDPTRD